MSDYLVPILICILLIYANIKKIQVFDTFTLGAKKGLILVFDIFPFILAIIIAVTLFRVSGLAQIFVNLLSPVFNFLGIPTEVCELVFLRPFSASGSFAILKDIYSTYGADSYISRCASVIMGSSETIFFVASVYFSKTSVKKLGIALPIALFSALLGAVVSCLLCKII